MFRKILQFWGGGLWDIKEPEKHPKRDKREYKDVTMLLFDKKITVNEGLRLLYATHLMRYENGNNVGERVSSTESCTCLKFLRDQPKVR